MTNPFLLTAHPLASQPAQALEGSERTLSRIAVRGKGRILLLRQEEIHWVAADGNYCRLQTATEVHRIKEGLTGLEDRLDPSRFLRVHRSTLVNLDRVREILVNPGGDYTLLLEGGHRLPLSRTYRERLLALLGEGDEARA